MRFKNVQDVAFWRLCVGCGACSYICPEKKIRLMDVVQDGVRPVIEKPDCKDCDECIKVCPGIESNHQYSKNANGLISELKEGWGRFLKYGKDMLRILIFAIMALQAGLQAPLHCTVWKRKECMARFISLLTRENLI